MGDTIDYSGPAAMTVRGRDVMAFHLHRYLGSWLEETGRATVLVTVGFEQCQAEAASFEISAEGCGGVDVVWALEDLCDVYRHGDARLHVEPPGEHPQQVAYDLVALLDLPHRADWRVEAESTQAPGAEEAAAGRRASIILGFALVERADLLTEESLAQLAAQATEAIRAARRNAMRLFFDENRALPVKSFLYRFMAHLPEWVGCDHSASILMTSSLEAMTLEASQAARFDFLAERLFVPAGAPQPRRLVGMSVSLEDESCGFVRAAVEHQMREPDADFQIFVRDEVDPEIWNAEPSVWHAPGAPQAAANRWLGFHGCDERSDEAMNIFVPMLAGEDAELEQLGFLVLMLRSQRLIAASSGDLLAECGEKLTSLLRYSPLYTLNARKLWVLGQTRAAIEAAVMSAPEDSAARVERLIGDVTQRLVRYVDVPSVAIAYLCERETKSGRRARHLRYAHPHGWTRFEQLNLPVDVRADQRLDSGISSLAVRIMRPLVLAGGYGHGENFAFKNYLYVHEDSGVVIDARSPQARGVERSHEWVRLSDYYKPARQSAYATLAFPIVFGSQPLGVLTVEVERDTNWQWWTGFGARLFWKLFANELAYAFHALGLGTPP